MNRLLGAAHFIISVILLVISLAAIFTLPEHIRIPIILATFAIIARKSPIIN